MSTNHTPNYSLSQWERTDKVLMDDFNADNAKIDAALKAEADARAAGDAAINAALSKRGNCQVWTTSYTGNGLYGSSDPLQIRLPGKPVFLLIGSDSSSFLLAHPGSDSPVYLGGSGSSVTAVWNSGGANLSLTSTSVHAQMNNLNQKYFVLALIDKN